MRLNTEFGIIFKVFDEFVLGVLSVKTRRRANAKDMGLRMISRKYLPVRIDKKVQKRFDLVFECGVFFSFEDKGFSGSPPNSHDWQYPGSKFPANHKNESIWFIRRNYENLVKKPCQAERIKHSNKLFEIRLVHCFLYLPSMPSSMMSSIKCFWIKRWNRLQNLYSIILTSIKMKMRKQSSDPNQKLLLTKIFKRRLKTSFSHNNES